MGKVQITKKAEFSMKAATAGKMPVVETPVTPTPTETPSSDKSPSKDYERFNFICSKDLASKARAISRKEGFTIRALMERAMTDFFAKYEEKNGEIGELISKDINDVL